MRTQPIDTQGERKGFSSRSEVFILAGAFAFALGRPLGQIAAQIMEWGWGR